MRTMTADEVLDRFRRNLKTIREIKGLSQSEVARRLGVPPSYICDMERGRRSPNLRTVAAIAEVLQTPAEIFIGPRKLAKQVKPGLHS